MAAHTRKPGGPMTNAAFLFLPLSLASFKLGYRQGHRHGWRAHEEHTTKTETQARVLFELKNPMRSRATTYSKKLFAS
jgi:hypothetical protein